jgi:hypothetical protein
MRSYGNFASWRKGRSLQRRAQWDIQAPTAADVALAFRYEGRGFEDGLDPVKKRLSARELGIRFTQLATAFKDGISKHFENRMWEAIE